MNDFWKGFKLMKPEDNEVFCIAYGSNLDETRMKQRCPSAEVFGTSVIGGYRLLFKQSMTGAYATMEQDANCCVPVVIYRITAEDELKLDRFEGYPKYYYKRDFLLPVWGLNGRKKKLRRNCIAYILHEYRMLGEPNEEYFDLLDRGYERWGFEKETLVKALEDSIGREAANLWLAEFYGEEDEHEQKVHCLRVEPVCGTDGVSVSGGEDHRHGGHSELEAGLPDPRNDRACCGQSGAGPDLGNHRPG